MYTNLWLATQELKAENNNPAAVQVVNNQQYLIQAIQMVEDRIETECEQGFAPRIITRTLDVAPQVLDVYNNRINLGLPYLSVTSLSIDGEALTQWDGQSSTRADADYHPYPRRETPFYDLQGMTSGVFIPDDDMHFTDGIEVVGITGYRKNYPAEGWRSSGDTVRNNPLTNSSTTLTVTDASAALFASGSPRFSEGDLLLIGSEFVRVWAVVDNTTLTIERGVRGSTAAEHAQGVAISIWVPQPEITRAATVWAVYMAKRRANFDIMKIDGGGAGTLTISTNPNMPDEVRGILARLRNPALQLRPVS